MRTNISHLMVFFLIIVSTKIYAQKVDIITGSFFKTEKAEKLNNEGIILSQNGDIKGGNEKFYKALKIEPQNPTVLSNIALNQNFKKNYKEAEKLYQNALIYSDSTYIIAGANLGILYYETREFEKGIEILNYVVKNESSPSLLLVMKYYRALSLIELGYCKKATKDLDYIEINRSSIENSRYYIKQIKKKLKNCVQQL